MRILHLSDLHISIKDNQFRDNILGGLIEDINHIVKKDKREVDVLVISGDITDKGGSKNNFNEAINLIKQLTEKTGNFKTIVSSIGNHDFARENLVLAAIKGMRESNNYDNILKTVWNTHKQSFEGYEYFINSINYSKLDQTDYLDSVKQIEYNGKTVRFISLNTSWSSIGESDLGKLIIPKSQLKAVSELLEKNRADLNLIIMHHPLEWFSEDSKQILMNSINEWNFAHHTLILNGHVHENSVVSKISPDYSVLNLTTGIGYNQTSGESVKEYRCRYSIYDFDINSGKVDVKLRVSNDHGRFSADTQLYRAGRDNGQFEMSFQDFSTRNEVENTGSETNNFELLDPVPEISGWVGRASLMQSVISGKHQIISISGIGGQGKTALASELQKKFKSNMSDCRAIWIDCKEKEHTIHNKLIHALDVLTNGKQSIELYESEHITQTIKRLSNHLTENNVVIVFDNVDAYIDFENKSYWGAIDNIIKGLLIPGFQSRVILTSRQCVEISDGKFRSVQLSGLNLDETIDFFIARGYKYQDDQWDALNDINLITKGHPWWLGLIAGQLVFKSKDINKVLKSIKNKGLDHKNQINQYFEEIWKSLKHQQQEILRYLSVSARPVAMNELEIVTSYSSIRLEEIVDLELELGLVEVNSSGYEESLYSIHPLVTEFIKNKYTGEQQLGFVKKWLYFFLAIDFVDCIFTSQKIVNQEFQLGSIVDSIETCIHSELFEQAYKLITDYSELLNTSSRFSLFISQSNQILSNVDWEKLEIGISLHSSKNFSYIIDGNYILGDELTSWNYLKKYESVINKNTIPYSGYLSIKAQVEWRSGKLNESLSTINEFYSLKERITDSWDLNDLQYLKATVLRDLGDPQEALNIFLEINKYMTGDYYGNIAKCYFDLGDNENGISNLIKSYAIMIQESDYMSQSNIGYAYMWAAEYLMNVEKFYNALVYISLCENHWKETTPGLLYLLDKLKEKFTKVCQMNASMIDENDLISVRRDFSLLLSQEI